MSKDKREGWLAGLKVGDKVVLRYESPGLAQDTLCEIVRVTPTGQMLVKPQNLRPRRMSAKGLEWANYPRTCWRLVPCEESE